MIYSKATIPDDLQKYFVRAEIGLEPTPAAFVAKMVEVFDNVRRVLKADGTLWLNLGDSYCTTPNGPGLASSNLQGGIAPHAQTRLAHARRSKGVPIGLKHKDMLGIPWRVAFALQEAGWYLRQDIIWAKPNPMPESVTDRCTKSHEYIFLLSKSPRYFYDAEAIAEPCESGESDLRKMREQLPRIGGKHKELDDKLNQASVHTNVGVKRAVGTGESRNKRDVWTVATQPFPGSHFATFPPELIRPCILAGCPEGGTVLDPFTGAGTTGMVSVQHGRNFVGIELNPKYVEMASRRIAADAGFMAVETPVGIARALCQEAVR